MNALVTGGAGFIGSHVVRALLRDGHRVRVLHLPKENLANLAELDVEKVAGDITDAGAARNAMRGCDWVFHLAAVYALWLPRPALMREVNVGGTRNILDAAADLGVSKVVFTSSIAVFGGQGLDRDATEHSSFALRHTGDLYCITKLESHRLAETYAARGLDVTIVAPTGPVGPGDIGPTPTGKLLLACLNLPVALVTDTVSNFGDVRDIAEGHLLAAHRGRPGESYLLGGENARFSDVARLAMRVLDLHKPVLSVPPGALGVASHFLVAWANRVSRSAPLVTPAAVEISRLGLRADCAKARRELGLPSRPLEETLRDAAAWFAGHGYVRSAAVRRKILQS
ncbi:MAG: NAD-dependent epimerase/dehydratase family protein [Candidatus Schekmanbacteria bacterium]|nr:NAD-dependent epimerase/dehydratase family protein [Candidatus Schekmanbacteria bacterium]